MPSSPRRSVRIAGRVCAITLGVIAVAGVAGAAWIGARALAAEAELREAQSAAAQLGELLTSNPAAAVDGLNELAHAATRARELTSDAVWQTAENLPWVGAQLNAVSTVTRSLDAVVGDVLPLASSVGMADLAQFAPVDGAFDSTALIAIRQPALRAADTARAGADAVAAIDRETLIGPITSPVNEAAAVLEEIAGLTDGLARTSEIVPAIMGSEGPRTYLIMMQNNAEWRSLGGMPGAPVLLQTDAGRMQIVDQSTGADLTFASSVDLPLDPEVEDLFGVRPGRYFQNTTQVPDFAVAGSLSAQFWTRATGTEVDGVISVDPVVLSYILAATGPITLSTGDVLTSDNAVSFLLNEVYLRYSVQQTDVIFAEAASAVFEALVSGDADPTAIVPALIRGVEERRVLLWTADAAEQALLAGTTIAGELPVTDDETARFGVYVNEGNGSKIDYYLALGTSVQQCADGQGALRVAIQSDAPADIEDYPYYVNGGNVYGVDPRTARTVTYVYLPRGAVLESAVPTSGGLGGQRQHDGLQVLTWQSDLLPGESATLDVVVNLPPSAHLEVVATPTINTVDTSGVSDSCVHAEY